MCVQVQVYACVLDACTGKYVCICSEGYVWLDCVCVKEDGLI